MQHTMFNNMNTSIKYLTVFISLNRKSLQSENLPRIGSNLNATIPNRGQQHVSLEPSFVAVHSSWKQCKQLEMQLTE
jgi:hypothetical protein